MSAAVDKLLTKLDAVEARLTKVSEKVEAQANTPAAAHHTRPLGVPNIVGPDVLKASAPFYLSDVVGTMTGQLKADSTREAMKQAEWFTGAMREHFNGYGNENSLLVPLAWDALPRQIGESAEGRTLKAMAAAGNRQYDPDHARWQLKSDQSAYAADLGGTFVPPPEFGQPIELLRNEEVFLKAGAQRVALPPQGAMQFPRLVSPTSAAAQPEAVNGSYSNVGTDSVTLTAKAYSVFVRMSNQLMRFAPALANGLITADMTKSLALKIDLDALEGPAGGQNNIKGLINYSNISTVTATTVGSNGNTIGRKDGKRMISKVFAANAKFTGWIMRYELFLNDISELSADAVTAGDGAGPYIFNITRGVGDNDAADFNWLRFPVHCSNQVSRSRVKNSGTTLTYVLGGDFSDYLMGLHGAVELATNDKGDTAWRANQTEVRAIAYADAAPRHEASFVLCDSLVYTA